MPILNLSKLTPCLKDTFFERRLIVPRKLLYVVRFGPLQAPFYTLVQHFRMKFEDFTPKGK